MAVPDSVAQLINKLDVTKFVKFLDRVVSKLPLPPGTRSLDIFSFDEREKLISVFELGSLSDLTSILDWIVIFFENIAFEQIKVDSNNARLSKLNDDHKQAVIHVWSSNGPALIDRMKAVTMSTRQLADVNFVLNVNVASRAKSQINQPTANVQFVTEDIRGQTEKLNVEFDHGQLLQLYDKLEDIQKQLDALTG